MEKTINTEGRMKFWEEMIREYGAVGVSTIFPVGKSEIGNKIIEIAKNEKVMWRVFPIYVSSVASFLTQSDWNILSGAIEFDDRYNLDNNRPEKSDILYITDLKHLNDHISAFERTVDVKNLPTIANTFAAIEYEAIASDSSRKKISRIILLPLNAAKDFAKECEKDPNLIIKVTNNFLPGLDSQIPRDKPEKIILTSRIREGWPGFKQHKVFKPL